MFGVRNILTDTWFNPNSECWELQRTGGVEFTFRNTVISTPTPLSLWAQACCRELKTDYSGMTARHHQQLFTIPNPKRLCVSDTSNSLPNNVTYLQKWAIEISSNRSGNAYPKVPVPVLASVVSSRAFFPFFNSLGVCCEWGLPLFHNLAQIKHGMESEVHCFYGCEEGCYHSTIHTSNN